MDHFIVHFFFLYGTIIFYYIGDPKRWTARNSITADSLSRTFLSGWRVCFILSFFCQHLLLNSFIASVSALATAPSFLIKLWRETLINRCFLWLIIQLYIKSYHENFYYRIGRSGKIAKLTDEFTWLPRVRCNVSYIRLLSMLYHCIQKVKNVAYFAEIHIYK